MFNTYNKFAYNINAVSGTLRKSHPKSKFCVKPVDDDNCIFNNVPSLYHNGKEIVILQAMLTGENKILVEYVYKEDFEKADEDNG